MNNYNIKINNFKIIIFAIVANFYINALFLNLFESLEFGGISLDGYVRFFFGGIISLLLLGQLKSFQHVFSKEIIIVSLILFLFSYLVIEIFIVNDKFLNLQGSVKYFFYFTCILLSLNHSYFSSKKTTNSMLKLALVFFASVILFYPYLVFKLGLNPIDRLKIGQERYGFLLGAGNEDAHFMVTLFPFVLAKFRNRKIINILIIISFFLALIYNGTRSALMMGIFLTMLFYFLTSKKKIFYISMILSIGILVFPFFLNIINLLFEKELGVIYSFNKLVEGEYVGGNLSGRITYIWLPAIYYTVKNSFWFGFGTNGWLIIAPKIVWASYAGTAYSPHNLFVWVLSCWGIIGFVWIVLFLNSAFKYSRISRKRSIKKFDKDLSTAIFASWLGFFTWSMLANSTGTHGWTVLILLVIISISHKNYIIFTSKFSKGLSKKEIFHESK